MGANGIDICTHEMKASQCMLAAFLECPVHGSHSKLAFSVEIRATHEDGYKRLSRPRSACPIKTCLANLVFGIHISSLSQEQLDRACMVIPSCPMQSRGTIISLGIRICTL